MDDRILISGIIAKDRRSLDRFYTRFAPALERFIAAKVSDPHDAQDILQDTLFAFLEGLRDFSFRSSLTTYLYSICNHKVIDFYRRRKFRHLVFSQIRGLEEMVSPFISPEDTLDGKIVAARIEQSLSRILPRYRRLLIAKYGENRSASFIADQFSISVKSVESALFRARKAFVRAFVVA